MNINWKAKKINHSYQTDRGQSLGFHKGHYMRLGLVAIVFAVSCMLVLTACHKQESVSLVFQPHRMKNSKKMAAQSKEIVSLKARLKSLMNPKLYVYNPAGKPDPFQPFWNVGLVQLNSPAPVGRVQTNQNCITPLACMDVGQLTLVAVVIPKHGRPMAMVQDASGMGYVLHIGTRIGEHRGRVYRILPGKVIVREEVKDLNGNLVYRKSVLLLHPED